jgi:Fic family protein
MLDGAPRAETEILALWLSDLMLAQKLGWEAPIALLATTIARPSLRSAGHRTRPDDAKWLLHCAKAAGLAAQDAHKLAVDLARRSAKLLAVLPKLRAKRAGRVITLLLDDDAVAPATAAKAAGLSDRASRRLFDRLVELKVVRELSGRPSFRLYGL